ncbi:MAG: hypothetical protein LC637_05300 [Xanthomonadaceae bacterium]|nr:hypothetical protein [Xanthomonadaceae bacterium]
MYCGRAVEQAPIRTLFATPRHRYTEGLIKAIPRIRPERLDRLPVIPGSVPDLARLPPGCRFAERCDYASQGCHDNDPEPRLLDRSRVACFHPANDDQRADSGEASE